ncbi:MAG: family 10 glycosylhydrolase [Vampirovibrionales bacterium]|nr:family 10 glycosylhydrolase [Vampirovibrionales bacterium]
MRHLRAFWIIGAAALAVLLPMGAAHAQIAWTLTGADGQQTPIALQNRPRPDNALVLYTSDYALRTGSNPYGVEAVLSPDASAGAGRYRVDSVSSVWDCERERRMNTCGDALIPPNGFVLSASGARRQELLRLARVGDRVEMTPQWFETLSRVVNAVDPAPANNTLACAFPGCRGGQQLVVYTPKSGRARTETNEFGFEATVVDGMVVAQEGANSTIPPNGFVLSGHGVNRDWLIAHAPLGARVTLSDDGKALTTQVDSWTYRYQLARRADNARCAERPSVCPAKGVDAQIAALQAQGAHEQAAALASSQLDSLNQQLWREYPAFPPQAIKAAWHRPVERSAAEIGRTLDFLQSAGINAVFLETFFHGYTLYPSDVMTRYGLPSRNPRFEGPADLLQTWINEARRRHMGVHAWFQTFYAGNRQASAPGTPPQGPILARYPQWANVQFSARAATAPTPSTLETGGYFLDPANPECRAFLLSLLQELATRYDLQGIQLDYIRYPVSFPPDRFSYLATTWGYTPTARAQFAEKTGFDPLNFTKPGITSEQQALWQDWRSFRAHQVSDFVSVASQKLHAVRPDLALSAVIFAAEEESLIRKHQDWPLWARQRWVDFLAPITLTSALKSVASDTERVVQRATPYGVPVVSGVFAPFNGNAAEDLLDQIEAARRAGAAGFAAFDTAHVTARMARALGSSQTGPPPTP